MAVPDHDAAPQVHASRGEGVKGETQTVRVAMQALSRQLHRSRVTSGFQPRPV